MRSVLFKKQSNQKSAIVLHESRDSRRAISPIRPAERFFNVSTSAKMPFRLEKNRLLMLNAPLSMLL